MPNFNKSGFFDYSINQDTYTAADFAKVMYSLNGDGVDGRYGQALSCSSSGNTITVASGAAWLQGYFGWNDSAVDMTVDSGTHKDYVCVHVDADEGVFELCIVKGTSSAYPTLDGPEYMPIAKAEVASGVVSSITDVRTFIYGSSGIAKQQFVITTSNYIPAGTYPDGTLIFRTTLA